MAIVQQRVAELVPRQGVLTLSGYGLGARVERDHLILEDGIGRVRRRARLPRVGHGFVYTDRSRGLSFLNGKAQ